MSIPKFEDFLYPFLSFLKDKDLSLKDMRVKMREHFSLSEEECISQKTKSGKETQFNDRLGWTRQYFRRALFIDIPKRGTYSITKRGRDFLDSHSSLSIDDLKKFKEFADYQGSNSTSGNFDDDLTPTEILDNTYALINDALSQQLLDKVITQSPVFFEKLVVDLLIEMGYGGGRDENGSITKQTGDDGIDGVIKEDKLGLDNIYLQAKRWTKNVSAPVIQTFIGALDLKKATKGVFITTSSFTKPAISTAQNSTKSIVLIDGKQLSKFMLEYNIGVSVKNTLLIKDLDKNYFEDL
jgi:restriction system protein